MKILYYSPHPNLSLNAVAGYGTHMREMIYMFEELGHEVLPVIAGPDIITNKPSPSLKRSSFKSLLKKIIPSILWHTLKDINLIKFDRIMEKTLRSKIKEFEPDFVYERINYLQLSGQKVCKEMGVCHFSEINAPYLHEKIELEGKSLLGKISFNREKKQLVGTDKIFTVSSILKKHFIKSHKLETRSKDIIVTPNAINVKTFVTNPDSVQTLKEDLKIKNDEVIIGFVGSILRWHGVDLLIHAFNKICKEFDKAKLLIVGDGESLVDIKEMTEEFGISDKVIFTGNSPYKEVPNYIQLMDITVMAKSNWYGSPLKIFEYGALKKAIIAPDFEPIHEVMNPYVDGIILNGEEETLESGLRKLVENKNLRDQLAENFYKKVLSKYTWKKNAEAVLDAYEKRSLDLVAR